MRPNARLPAAAAAGRSVPARRASQAYGELASGESDSLLTVAVPSETRRLEDWFVGASLSSTPVHEVAFDGALGSTRGSEETIAGLGRMFAMTEQVEVLRRWVDGPDVLTWFELRTKTGGPLAIVLSRSSIGVTSKRDASPGSG
jgi:hypothetical protein